MREIIENTTFVCGVVAFIGILGLPFFSFTIWGILSLQEVYYDLEEYGFKGYFGCEYWLNRHRHLVKAAILGIFPVCTVLFFLLMIPLHQYKKADHAAWVEQMAKENVKSNRTQ